MPPDSSIRLCRGMGADGMSAGGRRPVALAFIPASAAGTLRARGHSANHPPLLHEAEQGPWCSGRLGATSLLDKKKKKRMLCIPGEKWIKPFLVYDVGWRSRVQQSDLVLLFSDT